MLRNKYLRTLLVAAMWLAVWALCAWAVGQTLLLPSPLATGRALFALVQRSSFWLSCVYSVLRILLGFLIGVVLGGALAVLTCRSAWWHAFFSPFLSVIKATPVASFIVLALVWIKTNGVPVFATVLVVLPVIWANVSSGIRQTDAGLLEMARGFQLTGPQTVRRIYWPSVRPYAQAAMTTTMGMAWKAGVAAEVIATPRLSLGSHLYEAKIYLDTPSLFASTAVVILLSILLEKVATRLLGGGMGGKGRQNA